MNAYRSIGWQPIDKASLTVLSSYPSSDQRHYKSDNHRYDKQSEYPRHTSVHCIRHPIEKNHNGHNTGYGGHNSSHSVIFTLSRLNLFLIDLDSDSRTPFSILISQISRKQKGFFIDQCLYCLAFTMSYSFHLYCRIKN
jgi:hypothetical protein